MQRKRDGNRKETVVNWRRRQRFRDAIVTVNMECAICACISDASDCKAYPARCRLTVAIIIAEFDMRSSNGFG